MFSESDFDPTNGTIRIAFIIDEFHGGKLRKIKKISVAGVEWNFILQTPAGIIHNLEDMFRRFDVKENDTIIFTLNESDVLYGRICNAGAESNNIDLDNAVGTEDDATDVKQFTTYLSAGNVDKKTDGLVSIGFELVKVHSFCNKPACGKWKRRQKIWLKTDRGVRETRITTGGSNPSFSAGWNKFIGENEYEDGEGLNFRLAENHDFIDFHITKI
ncbi:hypothetical protein DCAR_0830880 [Daucus carota subsp. sativus]|uniref:TF-B3 domain-containing protein n=1 Tax=Daucus carota subsp. sativus TaxID=79200 RepID=A0A175YKP8_DAUCS|nr:hypothetical protein DCAR_0830880 [Daucus carota subsp. sativus]